MAPFGVTWDSSLTVVVVKLRRTSVLAKWILISSQSLGVRERKGGRGGGDEAKEEERRKGACPLYASALHPSQQNSSLSGMIMCMMYILCIESANLCIYVAYILHDMSFSYSVSMYISIVRAHSALLAYMFPCA